MGDTSTLSTNARTLASLLEPVVGQVYFSPECHEAYAALGFNPSPGAPGGVAMPDGPAYFTSRGSVMGQVPGEVVAAAFGVFNPAAVVPSVAKGWTLTDASTICAARDAGATGQLKRLLGDEPEGLERADEILTRAVEPLRPEGRALFAGVRSLGLPGRPGGTGLAPGRSAARVPRRRPHLGLDDGRLRRHRDQPGDRALLGPPHAQLQPHARLDRRRLRRRDGAARGTRCARRGGLHAHRDGAALREEVEVQTDLQMAPVIDALGDDAGELFAILEPWGVAVRDGKGYPASGPHDLARAAAR